MSEPVNEDLLLLRGGSWGISSQVIIDQRRGIVVSVLSNCSNVPAASLPAWNIANQLHQTLITSALPAQE